MECPAGDQAGVPCVDVGPGRGKGVISTAAPTGLTVAEVFDKFLQWCRQHRAARTYADHKARLQIFVTEMPDVAGLDATALKPFHVIEWVDKHAT